ncbi:hypothetical protein DRW41_04525 [Neobacillus piezotolerans]|uniref:Uncharacterized protein n=1 Tax=Neobacillus piezotolerans TaxID=2259171 RepID=A0A3D8GWK4_9BACI|nr:hypothetical protein [Neobacillus piezotolerans]RDU38828.1 hypothetical protein DRW41_04525 [Neobacillus piezotolerans]
MPAWVIGSVVGAWVLLFIIEEAGQFFWKRYVEDEPVNSRRGRHRAARMQWAAGLLERVKSEGAAKAGWERKHILRENAARFIGTIQGKIASLLGRVRSHPLWQRLLRSVGQFFKKRSEAIGNMRSHPFWERLAQSVGQFFQKGSDALRKVRTHPIWRKPRQDMSLFSRNTVKNVRPHPYWERLPQFVGQFFKKAFEKTRSRQLWQSRMFFVKTAQIKARISKILTTAKSGFATAKAWGIGLKNWTNAKIRTGLKSLELLLVKAVKLCIAGASTVIRKYRKSSTHL